MRLDMARAYVESLVENFLGQQKVEPDADGDYPLRFRSAGHYVRVVDAERPLVQVFSIALGEVAATRELLDELNVVNADIRFARIFHVRDQVLVETDILAEALDPAGFENACRCVASITDNIAAGLQQRHGGRLMFQDQATTEVNQAEATPSGGYL